MIKRLFANPVVTEGQEHIDSMKTRLQNNFDGRKSMAKEHYPSPAREFKLSPYKHQKDGLWYLRNFDGAALFADCGCISGTSEIRVYRGRGSCNLTLENAYSKFHNSWDRSVNTYVQGYIESEDILGPNKVNNIKQSGVKKVYRLLLANGDFVDGTDDHKIMTTCGWVQLGELMENHDYVMVDAVPKKKDCTVKAERPGFSKVVSVNYLGEHMTYDIVCADPNRNFVTNNIVVHNSGKTAMTLWDIETKYDEGDLASSTVLIVGKLMTLFSGWASDTLKFTDLFSEVLWEPSRSKDERQETEIICDHGSKPKGKAKSIAKTEYYFKDGEPAILDGPTSFKERLHVRKIREWKEVDGKKYGVEKLVTAKRTNLRAQSIGRKINSHEAAIHIINHEGLIKFEKELTARNYDYIVIDESTAIKNPTAKIFKALVNIAASTKYRRVLSGTPSPQGPQDLWSQFYFLDNGLTLGPIYKEFLEQHFDMITLGTKEAGTYKGVMPRLSPAHKRDTLGWIHRQLQNRVFRCKLRDCIDLPPIVISKLDVFLTSEQQAHYNDMRDAFYAEIDGDKVEVTVDLAKILKLRQITGGFILNRDGKVLKVAKTNPKLEVLKTFMEQLPKGEKVVIFAIHRAEISMLREYFGCRAVAIYGGVSDVKKLNAQDQFINNPEVDVVICQPQSAAYGVNGFTIARYLLFYSFDYRSDTNYQAIKRIERNGQTRAMFVYYLMARGTIDEVIYKVVQDKDEIQQKTIDVEIYREVLGISPT